MTHNPNIQSVRFRHPVLLGRLAPAFVAAVLVTASVAPSFGAANTAAIQAKLDEHKVDIDSTKAIERLKAKSGDLLLALVDTIDTGGGTAGSLAAGALRDRADRDKIAASVVEQAILAANAGGNATAIEEIITEVFGVVTSEKGRAAVIAAALRNTSGAATAQKLGAAIDVAIGIEDKQKFVISALTQVGSNGSQVKAFMNELFSNGALDAANRQLASFTIANSIASKSISAAGEVLGSAAPAASGNPTDLQISNYLAATLINAKKASKAFGETVSSVLADVDKSRIPAITATLADSPEVKANDTIRGQIAQGIARQGNAADNSIVTAIHHLLDANPKVSRSKFAAAAVIGVTAEANVTKLTQALLLEPGTTKPLDIVKALVKAAPSDSASGVVTAYLATTPTGGAAQFATDIATATTNALTIGDVIGAIAATQNTDAARATIAGNAIAKASKSATAIAMSVSELSSDIPAFALLLKDRQPKRIQEITVGASAADADQASGVIKAVLGRAVNDSDRSIFSKAVKIATAVSAAVGVEEAAEVAFEVATLMSVKGAVAGKPLQASTAGTLASGIAKAINSKAGVSTANRADEMGEVGAAIVQGVLAGIPTEKDAINIVSQVASSIVKALSKKELVSTLGNRGSDNEINRNPADIGRVKLGPSGSTSLETAPQSNIANIAGSILAAARAHAPSAFSAQFLGDLQTKLLATVSKLGGKYRAQVELALNQVMNYSAQAFADQKAYETGVDRALVNGTLVGVPDESDNRNQ